MPEGLISGKLNKGIEMKGFWSCSKLNFYKKKSLLVERQEIVHSSSEAFRMRQSKNVQFLFLDVYFKMRKFEAEAGS